MKSTYQKLYDLCPSKVQELILSGYAYYLDRQRYGGKFSAYREFMEKSQWYSMNELSSFQEEKLQLLIKHAYETVPYYRKKFDNSKLKPNDIKQRQDLCKLPILTREDIKVNFTELISTAYKPNKLKYGHTSGTTGAPLQIGYDAEVIYATYSALGRQYQWAGCHFGMDGDRVAVLRGNIIVPLSNKKRPFWRLNHTHNQLLLSSFHISERNLHHYMDEIERFNPAVFDGYPSTLYVLAKFMDNNGITFPAKSIITSSETLYDFQRVMIEKSFQCRVFDYYALAERVVFATECDQHQGHHLAMEYGISEILDLNYEPLPDGVAGKLVGTSLHNFGMPLIRYVTNDISTIRGNVCSCGRSLQLMDDVTTKAEDSLTLKDGRVISPSVLTHPFKPLNSVEESQIIQKTHDLIIIKIVPRADYSDADSAHLIREMKLRLGQDVRVKIEMVKRLERAENGKFRWVISDVPLGI